MDSGWQSHARKPPNATLLYHAKRGDGTAMGGLLVMPMPVMQNISNFHLVPALAAIPRSKRSI